jgi:hypothetical protein
VRGPGHPASALPEALGDAIAAGGIAAAISGLPSTFHALLTHGDPLRASEAAGSMLLPSETSRGRLLLAAVPVHLCASLGWAAVLTRILPRRRTSLWGGIAGTAIAVIDLRLVGRLLFPHLTSLPFAPQVADHVLFGMTVGAVLQSRRKGRLPG